MSGEVVSRAPFECVCGFTAGTSFAWEKHLALRNTPYSSVKHSRVIRGSDGTKKLATYDSYDGYEQNSSWGVSSPPIPTGESQYPHTYPTPKALFRDTRTGSSLAEDMAGMKLSDSHGVNRATSGGMRLEEAARAGDMDRVARIAVEILRLAQQGDAKAVLNTISVSARDGAVTSGSSSSKGKALFSSNITTVHAARNGGISIEHVATGLPNVAPLDQPGRKDALRLLAMTEPMLDAARETSTEPVKFGVDTLVLKRTIIAVAQQASRITARESRLLEIPSPVYVLGDIHANLYDLQFFRKTIWPAGPEVTAGEFLFLGDFVDRGKDSIAVIAYIMAMKILNPGKWWMIRGNHETREVNGNVEHYGDGSFLAQCIAVFGESDGYAVWEAVNNFFDTLPLAAAIDDTIFAVHGGVPKALCQPGSSLDLIRRMPCPLRFVQSGETVYDMLWSDPSSPEQETGHELDSNGFGQSARGCTCFSERSIALFLEIHGFKHVFRGHEAQQSGIGVSKNSLLTTIFSTSKDHFAGDITSTCGCVLVDHGTIHPIVRALPALHVGVKPTYAGQSIEATEVPSTAPAPAGGQLGYGGLTGISSSSAERQQAQQHLAAHGTYSAYGGYGAASTASHLLGERQLAAGYAGGAGMADGSTRHGVNSWLEESYNMRLRADMVRPVGET